MGLWIPRARPSESLNSRIRILDKDGILLREIDPISRGRPPCRMHKTADCRKCAYAGYLLPKVHRDWPSWETDPDLSKERGPAW